MNGGWAFESTDDVESQADQKRDHLYFGYWLQMPADADGDHAFATFWGGGMGFTDTAIRGLTGEATYNGAAGGKYVTKELALVEGKVETASAVGGYFTADATLTAVFGGPLILEGDRYGISGTIDNFKDGVTGEDLGFNVNLTKIGIMEGGPYTSATVTAAHGTVPNTDGGWNVGFFGPVGVNDDATPDDESLTTLPTGVAGDFNVEFPDADLAGGFAATRE